MKRLVVKHIYNSIMIGVFSTAMMDLTSTFLSSLHLIGNISFSSFGRIAGAWFQGQFIYASIADVVPLQHEWIIGFLTHYLIGSILAFFIVVILEKIRPKQGAIPLLALIYGITTVVLPWFLLAPSVGFGFLGLDAPEAAMFLRTSLTNHFTYGVGLSIGCFLLFNMEKLPLRFQRFQRSYSGSNTPGQTVISIKNK